MERRIRQNMFIVWQERVCQVIAEEDSHFRFFVPLHEAPGGYILPKLGEAIFHTRSAAGEKLVSLLEIELQKNLVEANRLKGILDVERNILALRKEADSRSKTLRLVLVKSRPHE